MTPTRTEPCKRPLWPASVAGANAVALLAAGALWLSGCVSPYQGCVIPGSVKDTQGPPAAWVQRNVPISPAPVQYSQRVGMPPPGFTVPPSGPVMELGVPMETPPAPMQIPTPTSTPTPMPVEWQPTPYVPPAPGPQTQTLPPQAPPAETQTVFNATAICADTAKMQAKIDELSAMIAALDRRTQDQAQELDTARQETQTAQQATQRLEADFATWKNELNLVRDAIHQQSAADVQMLDELNSALEQLVPEASPPEPDQFVGNGSRRATGQQQGARR